MASEITYAEVKFKNEPPAPVAKVPPETKEPEHHPQKYPLWLPWLISLLLLLVCFALVVALLVLPCSHSSDQPRALQQQQQQQFSEWKCDSAVPQGTDRGWTCCPTGWRRFQRSCYFLSLDRMNWAESEQNCTGMGSQLVVINSEAEQDFLSGQIKETREKRENFFIGLFAEKVGQWQWVDKAPYNVTATFWRKGEPSNVAAENGTVMHAREQNINNWNDVKYDVIHHRICEAAAVTV